MNVDFATPRHSLLKPHGPHLILSPTRSGPHIPVAHVSPLRKDPPDVAVSPGITCRAGPSQHPQLSMPRNKRSQYVEGQIKRPSE